MPWLPDTDDEESGSEYSPEPPFVPDEQHGKQNASYGHSDEDDTLVNDDEVDADEMDIDSDSDTAHEMTDDDGDDDYQVEDEDVSSDDEDEDDHDDDFIVTETRVAKRRRALQTQAVPKHAHGGVTISQGETVTSGENAVSCDTGRRTRSAGQATSFGGGPSSFTPLEFTIDIVCRRSTTLNPNDKQPDIFDHSISNPCVDASELFDGNLMPPTYYSDKVETLDVDLNTKIYSKKFERNLTRIQVFWEQ